MILDPDLRISIDDVRRAGHCPTGVRAWFEQHDLDFRDFLANGIDADLFLQAGDALAEQVVERKLSREQDNG